MMVDARTIQTPLTLCVSQSENGLRTARAVLRAVLEARGVDRDRMDDSLLVAGELLANALQHGRSDAVMDLDCVDDELRITVTDPGPGFRLEEIPPAGSLRGGGRFGGFGIPLVKTLCSRVDWKSSEAGTRVEAVVSLNSADAIPCADLKIELLGLSADDAAWLLGEGADLDTAATF